MTIPASRALLARLPKAELHCHLDGSLRPGTMLELAREYGVVMPRRDADSLRDFMVVRDARSLEDYLQRFETTLAVMQTEESIERIAYELAEDASREGVWYLETRFAPVLNTRRELSLDEAVEAAVRGLARAERDHGIIGRVIVCGLRNFPPAVSLELAELAIAYRGRGVVGFDLAGGELGNPASRHVEAFRLAHEHALPCTCHAGEGNGAASVAEAVHVCGAQRIGHATRLIEDPELTGWVAGRRIPLEICLTSNIQTHAAVSYDTHPMRAYFDRGMPVVLNTDNRLMSGTTLTDEYEHAARELGFGLDDLCRIALSGFESAFLPAAERVPLVRRAREEMQHLLGDASRVLGERTPDGRTERP
jgi:adenosine deaminase